MAIPVWPGRVRVRWRGTLESNHPTGDIEPYCQAKRTASLVSSNQPSRETDQWDIQIRFHIGRRKTGHAIDVDSPDNDPLQRKA